MSRFKTIMIRSAICGLLAAGLSFALVRVHPFSSAGPYAVSREPAQVPVVHWTAQIDGAKANFVHSVASLPQAGHSDVTDVIEGDASRGRMLFEKRCTGCHSLTQNREGPQLQGVYGRVSGTAEGFAYSAALKKAQIVWDAPALDKWLTEPDAFIPGNEMDFLISKPQERRDLIRFLKEISGK